MRSVIRSTARRWKLLARQEGQALIEYAFILSLVGMLALGGLSLAGANLRDTYGRITGRVGAILQPGTTTTPGAAVPTTTTTAKKNKKK